MKVSVQRYNLGFTASGLGTNHLVALAKLYCDFEDWGKVASQAIEKNIFRQPKEVSSRRLLREFRARLANLTPDQISLLLSSDMQSRLRMALLAVFKRYHFITDFSLETLIPKIESFDYELRHSDYSYFVEGQEDLHPELMTLAETSRRKLRQITLRILTDGEILSSTTPVMITPPYLSSEVVDAIEQDSPSLLRPFLYHAI